MTYFTQVSWTAVGSAFLTSMLLGMLWYGPLFGQLWMRLIQKGRNSAMRSVSQAFAIGSLAMFLSSYVLTLLLSIARPQAWSDAITVSFLLIGAVSLPMELSRVAWEGHSFKLFLINAGWQVTSIVVMVSVVFWMQNVYGLI